MTHVRSERTTDSARSAPQLAQAACARIYEFNRLTMWQQDAQPSDISESIAHLAALIAALPQAFNQLAHCLHLAETEQILRMDSMSADADGVMAVDVARLELQEASDLAVDLYRLLDAAHNSTAHIVSDGLRAKRSSDDDAV